MGLNVLLVVISITMFPIASFNCLLVYLIWNDNISKYIYILSFSINANVQKCKFCAYKCYVLIPTYKHETRLEIQMVQTLNQQLKRLYYYNQDHGMQSTL